MAHFPRTLTLLSYLVALLALTTYNLVNAADYSLTAPTGATRWVAGQQGLVIIVSTKRAKADPPPAGDSLLTITLQRKNSFLGSTTVATIRDGLQLLMSPTDTEPKTVTISDFIVPLDLPAGDKYFVHLKESGGFLGIGTTADSPNFQIITSAPDNTTTGVPTPTPTIMPNVTTTATVPTPTLPPGQTCKDIQEQCAAQGLMFLEGDQTTVCHCGDKLIVPTVIRNSAPGSVKSTVKSTFQSTGGPTAALAFMLLVVMTLF